jgi:Ni/Co efflux regulator RcnB
MMKLKSLIVAVLMLAVAGASMAQTAVPAKKSVHKKVHVVKKHHKVKHKKAAAM